MKKIIIILSGVLAAVFIILSLWDFKGEYVAEKALWRINKDYDQLVKDPKAVPDANFESIIRRYRKFLKQYPDSNLTPVTHILIGKVYVTSEQYDKAREVFEEVVSTYPEKPKIAVQAVMEKAQTYSIEKKWDEVIESYDRVIKEYPLTEQGFQAPLLKSEFYIARGEIDSAQKSLAQAVEHYQMMMRQHPTEEVEFNALRSLSICYMAQKKWRDAVVALGDVLLNFAASENLTAQRADKIIKSINTISVSKLKDYDLPVSIYQKFIDKHPKNRFKKIMEDMIRSLLVLKAQKVELITEEKSP